jgi:membrane-associated protein
MDSVEFFRTIVSAEKLRALLETTLSGWYAYAALFAIVFAETGLLVGFFLPGDSLLFVVGVVAGAGKLDLPAVMVLLSVAAIVGDGVGYYLGRQAGPAIFDRPDSRWFKHEHLIRTQRFYEKHGGKTIIYARFIPIIRTFAPFVAGVAKMNYARFLSFNIFGGIGWVVLLTLLGYLLGNQPFVRRHFDKAILVIIALSVTPLVWEAYKGWRKRSMAR